LVAGIAALVAGLYIGSRLTAQQGSGAAAPQPQTRVAVMNLPKVIKDYHKTVKQEDEIKQEAQKYEPVLKELSTKINNLKSTPISDPVKVAAAKEELKKLERDMADRTEERNSKIQAKSTEAMQTLYKDVEGAVSALARSRNIELVFFYNDAIDPNSKYNPEVLRMKVGSSGMPIYTAPGLEITAEVVNVLNYNYDRLNTPTGATAPGH
jgi:Skp family chaperone for outer membrane proteins